MRAVVQRSSRASVTVADTVIGEIGQGLTVLLGVGREDDGQDVKYLAEKIVNLRIFSDREGKMNLSLLDIQGELLVVSQFTLYGDCRRGRRPGFDAAGQPKAANKYYEEFIEYCRINYNIKVATGQFQADMNVQIENSGPVTILLDSKKGF